MLPFNSSIITHDVFNKRTMAAKPFFSTSFNDRSDFTKIYLPNALPKYGLEQNGMIGSKSTML